MKTLGRFVRWETLLAIVLILLVWFGTVSLRFFLTGGNFANMTSAVMEVSIMALAMTFIIIAAEIDLSVESIAGLAAAVLGFLWASGIPLEIGIPMVIVMGAVCGLLNGLLVTIAGLPSLVVTLGTLALFRGLALVVLGPRAISNFPPEFNDFGFGTVPGTPIPWPLVVFAILAVIFGIVLHATTIGRQIFAVGKNPEAARFSGIRVGRLKTGLFVLSGVVAALAGVILTSRLSSARADTATGMTLTVVTIVLLGGVSIFGGRGTIAGVVLAVFTIAVLQNELRLARVSAELQSIILGLLLILSVALPSIARQARYAIDRARGGRAPPAGSVLPGEEATA
jgi:rhamnose transport system permease protein